VPGELEQARDRVPVGCIPGVRHRERTGRVGGHHLDLHALARLGRRAGAERVPCFEDLADGLGEPRVGDAEVDETRPGGLGCLGEAAPDRLRRDLAREVAGRPRACGRESQRDVGRVVAVLRIVRPLELDRRVRDVGEMRGEAGDGIGDGHGAHRRRGPAGRPRSPS
jgi:hypothetical protein